MLSVRRDSLASPVPAVWGGRGLCFRRCVGMVEQALRSRNGEMSSAI